MVDEKPAQPCHERPSRAWMTLARHEGDPRVFHPGIGKMIVVDPYRQDAPASGIPAVPVGEVRRGRGEVRIGNA